MGNLYVLESGGGRGNKNGCRGQETFPRGASCGALWPFLQPQSTRPPALGTLYSVSVRGSRAFPPT